MDDIHVSNIEKLQCLSNVNSNGSDGNADIAAAVPKRDIETDIVSESSSDYGSEPENDPALDEPEKTINVLLLNFGNIFIELYRENADIDDEDVSYLASKLAQIYSNNYYLTQDVSCYICARIPPKELMKAMRFVKGHPLDIALKISYIGSCGWLLHELTKFRKKGSINYESEEAI